MNKKETLKFIVETINNDEYSPSYEKWSNEDIISIEKELNIQFPNSFKEITLEFGNLFERDGGYYTVNRLISETLEFREHGLGHEYFLVSWNGEYGVVLNTFTGEYFNWTYFDNDGYVYEAKNPYDFLFSHLVDHYYDDFEEEFESEYIQNYYNEAIKNNSLNKEVFKDKTNLEKFIRSKTLSGSKEKNIFKGILNYLLSKKNIAYLPYLLEGLNDDCEQEDLMQALLYAINHLLSGLPIEDRIKTLKQHENILLKSPKLNKRLAEIIERG